jgi:hypothetical protein
MTPEQKENLKAGIKALRDNPQKANGIMRDENGGRCCLCVLFDTAVERGYTGERNNFMPKDTLSLANFFGMKCDSMDEIVIDYHSLQAWNDGADCEEKTHVEIADMLEKKYLDSGE